MDDGTGKLVAKIIKYREIYENVGCGEITLRNLLERIPDVSELKPFLVEKRQGLYAMDFEKLATVLHDFYEGFLPGIFTHERIYELARRYMPEKLICDAEEVELDGQSYKFLYKSMHDKYKNLEEEFHTQRIRLDGCQSELADLNIKVQSLKEGAGIYGDSTQSLMRFIRNMIDGDIRVSSAYAADANGEKIQASSDRMAKADSGDIADCPGVYGFKRPSWFTKLRADNELNQKNAARKAAGNTSPLLREILRFWRSLTGAGFR